MNTAELDHCMDEIQKITKKQMDIKNKMGHIWWMVNIIAINREKTNWVVGGPGVNTQQIIIGSLKLMVKA